MSNRKTAATTDLQASLLAACAIIQKRSPIQPRVGIVLGSGLGGLADLVQEAAIIPYAEIPQFFPTTVEGHLGRLVLGHLSGVPVAVLQGRFHYYEGFSMSQVAFPVRTLCTLGVKTICLTNAAGGINAAFAPGDLMLITDHINMMGDSPLRGPNPSQLGPRFPDMCEGYNKHCREILVGVSKKLGISLHQGVYGAMMGPAYETPAEIRMLRTIGADAVGMSTAPETLAIHHMGVKVCGISLITNVAAGLSPDGLNHDDVMKVSQKGGYKLQQLILAALPELSR